MRFKMYTSLKQNIIKIIESNLPGVEAQNKLSPSIRNPMRTKKDNETKKSAVIILIYPRNHILHTLFIERSKYNGHHSGQIAFPGGKFELGDISLENTVLRETKEEIGICISKNDILGKLTNLYIPISNIIVSPFVAYIDEAPLFLVDKYEVQNIIEIPISDLLEKNKFKTKIINTNNISINAPYFDAKGNHVWGATAMILGEFIEVLKRSIH